MPTFSYDAIALLWLSYRKSALLQHDRNAWLYWKSLCMCHAVSCPQNIPNSFIYICSCLKIPQFLRSSLLIEADISKSNPCIYHVCFSYSKAAVTIQSYFRHRLLVNWWPTRGTQQIKNVERVQYSISCCLDVKGHRCFLILPNSC